jgi:hypothetical protein
MKRKEKFEGYSQEEYPEVTKVKFPREIYIAYAVYGKSCGNIEFIVDGQSQVCQYCGKLMFRTEIKKYLLEPQSDEG